MSISRTFTKMRGRMVILGGRSRGVKSAETHHLFLEKLTTSVVNNTHNSWWIETMFLGIWSKPRAKFFKCSAKYLTIRVLNGLGLQSDCNRGYCVYQQLYHWCNLVPQWYQIRPPTMVSVGHDMFYDWPTGMWYNHHIPVTQMLFDHSFVDEIISTPPELL